MLDWIPRKLRYALGVLTVLSLAIPTGLSHDTVITGHTVYKNMGGYDKCLASIVGLARTRVLWFNDATLVETDAKGQYIYATRAGAPPPPPTLKNDARPIFGDGVVYEFVDPNNARWIVLEGYYYGEIKGDPINVNPWTPGDPRVEGGARVDSEIVWLVQVGQTIRDNDPGSDDHEFYNFVTLVDTCKFGHGAKSEGTLDHAADDPNHPPGEHAHNHEVFEVDLYIGKEPTFVPLGVNATNPGVHSETIGTVTV